MSLLCGGEPTQFHYLHPDHHEGTPAIRYKVVQRKLDNSDRWADPSVMLLVRAHVLYGGGVNIDASSTGPDGMSYPNLFGGPRNVKLGRLVTNARPGRLAKFNAGAPFRRVSSAALHTASEESVRAEGKPVRSPCLGREEAIERSLGYFRRNSPRTDIGISEAEYAKFLREAYRLHDTLTETAT